MGMFSRVRRHSRTYALALAASLAAVAGGAFAGCSSLREAAMGGGGSLGARAVYAQGVGGPGQPLPDRVPRGIIVVGTGEVKASPDVAHISLGVEGQAQTARQALSQVSSRANDVIAALRRLGITDRQIQTTAIDLTPIRESPRPPRPGQPAEEPQGPPPILGYRANNQVRVTVTNLDQLGNVIDAAIDAGANVARGIQFALENDTAARQEALRRAVQEARSEADVLANALGLSITGIQTVIEEEAGVITPGPVFAMAEARGGGAAPPVQPGELTVRKRIQVIFSIG